MKNYMEKRGCNAGGEWNDPFEIFFKPIFTGDRRGEMKTDIKESDAGYDFAIDVPGYDKKDVSVTLENGYLTVEAKRHESSEDKKNYVRRERSYSCSRSYYVGDDVTEEDVKAKYENGTLNVFVPKKEEKQAKSGVITVE